MAISLQSIENRVTNLESKHGLKWFFAGRVISDESIYTDSNFRYHFSIPKSAKHIALIGSYSPTADVHGQVFTIDELVNGSVKLDGMAVALANGSYLDEIEYYICRINVYASIGYDNSTFIWYTIDL